jgi:2TM domain
MQASNNPDRRLQDPEPRLRDVAEAHLRKRQDFAIHVAAYLAVNGLFVSIWAFFGGEFWPIVPLVIWGAALGLHGWSVFLGPARRAGADPIAREMDRLRDRGVAR